MRPRSVLVLLALSALAVIAGFALFEWATWPDVRALARANPETTAFIERWRSEQRAAGKSDRVEWTPVAYERISPELKLAAIVGEDYGFFWHPGFDVSEMKDALREAWAEKELPRGASTITQQLAKNLWLSPSRNPWRKAKEALLTRALERRLPKRRILDLYLNVVELGPGIYGVEAASRRYFGRSAADLDAREAAELAGSLPAPRQWHPGSADRGYRHHVRVILARMARADAVRRLL